MIFKQYYLAILCIFLVTTGCGDNSTNSEKELINNPTTVNILGLTQANEGQSIEFIAEVNSPEDIKITDYSWSLSPKLNIKLVKKGNKISFVTPDVNENTDISISVIIADTSGNSVQSSHPLTVSNITLSHNITVIEAQNGSITPETIGVEEGSTYTFTVSPEENYEIASIYGCEGVLNNHFYSTSPIFEDCEINVSFQLMPLSKQANIQNTELASCVDTTNYLKISDVTVLSCPYISNIQGLEVFSHLEDLELTQAELSGNVLIPHFPALGTLRIQQKSHLKKLLTNIDTTLNSTLTDVDITHTAISTLDVNLLTNLENLRLPYNEISEMDLSALHKLESIHIYDNQLTQLSLEHNSKLTHVFLNNNNFASVQLNGNENLVQIDLSRNNISTIDLSNNINLKYLSIGSNKLMNVDLTHNVNLEKIWLDTNEIKNLNVNKNNSLNLVWAQNNKLENVAGIESIIDKNVYFSLYNNRFSSEEINYLKNLKDNLGYSGLKLVE